MKTLPRFLVALLPALMIVAAGCTPGDSSSSTTGGTTSTPAANNGGGKEIKLAFVTNNSSDFWTIARKGVEKADAELANVTVDFKMPSDGTAAGQRRIVDDLIAAGLDGMAISPVDPANQTDMINSAAKQALVFTQDSDAPDSDRACYVGTDNRAAGRQAGEELKKALPNGGKVMVFVGMIDAQNAKERFEGIKEAIAGSKIEIVDVRTDKTDRVAAKSNVSDTLVKYPDIAGLVGLWSYNGPAILNAVKEAGKAGQVKIVCFDEEDETLAGVKEGAIFSTIVQQPYEFGYQSVKLMAAVKEGKTDAIPANKLSIVPTLVIDKAGVDAFKTKLDGLRGR
jgi:ribose transport system substrate-binding protein